MSRRENFVFPADFLFYQFMRGIKYSMRCKSCRRGRAKRIVLSVAAFILLFAALSVFSFTRAAAYSAALEVRSACARSVNAAVMEGGLDNLFSLTRGEKNQTVIYVNSSAVNFAAYGIAARTEKCFGEECPSAAEAGVLSFLGFTNSAGAKINLKLDAKFIAESAVEYTAEPAGINGFVFTIYCNLNCEISYSCAFSRRNFSVNYRIPLAQCVAEGEVPEVYMR